MDQNGTVQFSPIMSRYGFILPILAPIGFYLKSKIPYAFNSRYDQKVRGRLVELFGYREINLFIEVHLCQKISLTAASFLLFSLLYLLGDTEYSFIIFGLMVTALLYYWVDKDLDKKIKEKKRDILIDLPEFINTLALLVNAGLSFSRAIQKVVSDKDNNRPLYRELSFMLADINAGKPVGQAYEELAQKCKVPEITRLVSVVLQNMNRGSADLVYVLRALAGDAWEKRKDIAKKKGEEASSKLVFPMVMVFIAIAIIVLAPAVLTMSR